MPKQTGGMVDAVQTTCEILDILQARKRAGVTEISDEIGMSKGAIHRHLKTLDTFEYIVNENGEYRLSLRYLDMANQVKESVGNHDVITEELRNLATEIGEIAQFATEEHGWVRYVHKANSETGVQTASSAGKREYMHSTALGKAMLAEMTDDRVMEILDRHGMPSKTPSTITEHSTLLDELDVVRDRGYALDNQENIGGLRCVAMPVIDAESNVFGAVSISGPVSRMTDKRIAGELADTLARSTNVIEINSKFS